MIDHKTLLFLIYFIQWRSLLKNGYKFVFYRVLAGKPSPNDDIWFDHPIVVRSPCTIPYMYRFHCSTTLYNYIGLSILEYYVYLTVCLLYIGIYLSKILGYNNVYIYIILRSVWTTWMWNSFEWWCRARGMVWSIYYLRINKSYIMFVYINIYQYMCVLWFI